MRPLTTDALAELASRASVESPNATDGAIFYSGKNPYDANASAIGLATDAAGKLAVIDETTFAYLIDSPQLKNAYKDATGRQTTGLELRQADGEFRQPDLGRGVRALRGCRPRRRHRPAPGSRAH
ncbi:hypothetical protein J1G43_18310 [Cellulomonas sp. zg-ZUI22]|uniref:hypothetical protein n=1 Tax=Cellulomonas sp. zg-ZUI22 TaxID=2816955 RepID=UPI001A9408A3|nr:hypothetical protein [Cellulomonas sp. zg-ZUI22]MBO0901918.1 hypothetical protein [Cellulomonas sp. zg-ZUI22]